MPRLSGLVLIIFLIFVSLNCCNQNDSSEQSEIFSTDDGPHVYWSNDSTAIVIYLCNDSVITRKFEVKDTLCFKGLCFDSAQQYIIPRAAPAISAETYTGVSKIYVLSDIHGEYEYLRDNLILNGIIDSALNWVWGDGHLLINGDIFDRGDMVTECFWLIYNLEHQARQSGGQVHFLLGNHEIMPLQADLRYVHDKYMQGICKKTRIKYEDLFGPLTELGRWLRAKNTAIKINDVLFVHGGIGPDLIDSGYTIARLNQVSRYGMNLNSLQYSQNDSVKFMYKSYGPFWYRGFHCEMEDKYPRMTESEIDRVLDYYQASAAVVGHTGVDSICDLYNNKIFAIDIPFEDLRGLEGLLIENGKFYRVTVDGRRILLGE